MNHFFAYMARMKLIRRWGLMRSMLPENDAEHTLQTAMIAHGLALIRREVMHIPCDPEHCAVLAMYHEVSEIFTGDMPTPVKYFSRGLRESYKAIEQQARRNIMGTLPEELQPFYSPYILHMEEDGLWPLVKAADTLSAFLKCAEEKQAGNREFGEAYETIRTRLYEMKLPEVNWFMDHFAGSFALTLDQMKTDRV